MTWYHVPHPLEVLEFDEIGAPTVLYREVGQTADRWLACDGAVGPMTIVEVERVSAGCR